MIPTITTYRLNIVSLVAIAPFTLLMSFAVLGGL